MLAGTLHDLTGMASAPGVDNRVDLAGNACGLKLEERDLMKQWLQDPCFVEASDQETPGWRSSERGQGCRSLVLPVLPQVV